MKVKAWELEIEDHMIFISKLSKDKIMILISNWIFDSYLYINPFYSFSNICFHAIFIYSILILILI